MLYVQFNVPLGTLCHPQTIPPGGMLCTISVVKCIIENTYIRIMCVEEICGVRIFKANTVSFSSVVTWQNLILAAVQTLGTLCSGFLVETCRKVCNETGNKNKICSYKLYKNVNQLPMTQCLNSC